MVNSDNSYRYTLEKGSKKFICPKCGRKSFKRYIDTKTGDYLPEKYGRCDHESKCGYHLNPYADGYAKSVWEREQKVTKVTKVTPQTKSFFSHTQLQSTPIPVFFDFETFKQTLQPEHYGKNTFIQNLLNRVKYPFTVDDVTKVIRLYRLGTIADGYMAGAVTFPFIDIHNNVRAVQVKQFDSQNHTTNTNFLHSMVEREYAKNRQPLPAWLELYKKNDKLITCLFGEHILHQYPNNPIALVEAPKTAIYATLYFGLPENPDDLIWLAVYNKSSFTIDKIKALQGRFVYVFPDLSKDGSTFKEWETKAKDFESHLPKTNFALSDLLERLAPDRDKSKGYDIADYLIALDWRQFRKQSLKEQPPAPEIEKVTKVTKVTLQKNNYFNDSPLPLVENLKPEQTGHIKKGKGGVWDGEIKELENFFEQVKIPTEPVKLNRWTTIDDYPLFIKSHFDTVKAQNGNRTFLPYLERLQELKLLLSLN